MRSIQTYLSGTIRSVSDGVIQLSTRYSIRWIDTVGVVDILVLDSVIHLDLIGTLLDRTLTSI